MVGDHFCSAFWQMLKYPTGNSGKSKTIAQRRWYLPLFCLLRQVFRTDRPRGCPAALSYGIFDRSVRFGSAHGRRGQWRRSEPSSAGPSYMRRRWPSDSKSAAGTQVSRPGMPASHPIQPILVVPVNGRNGANSATPYAGRLVGYPVQPSNRPGPPVRRSRSQGRQAPSSSSPCYSRFCSSLASTKAG